MKFWIILSTCYLFDHELITFEPPAHTTFVTIKYWYPQVYFCSPYEAEVIKNKLSQKYTESTFEIREIEL